MMFCFSFDVNRISKHNDTSCTSEYLPLWRPMAFPRERGVTKANIFWRGGGAGYKPKNLLSRGVGGSIDIFWNHTLCNFHNTDSPDKFFLKSWLAVKFCQIIHALVLLWLPSNEPIYTSFQPKADVPFLLNLVSSGTLVFTFNSWQTFVKLPNIGYCYSPWWNLIPIGIVVCIGGHIINFLVLKIWSKVSSSA